MIKYLVMDVDGTLTDGKIYMGASGELFKAIDVKDGYGIHSLLKKNNIIPVIITGRNSEIVSRRAMELNITEIYQGVTDKLRVLEELLISECNSFDEVAYIGDDINDMECMMTIKNSGGYVGCPNDAIAEVKQNVSYICSSKGGSGAVREFISKIININNGVT